MLIRTKLSEKDFVAVNFELLYKRWFIRIISVVAILEVVFVFTELVSHSGYANLDFSMFIFPAIALGGFPLLTYFGAKRNYKTAGKIHETIEYNFTPEYLDIKGESFTSQLGWSKFYKVTKSKEWLLIYQSRQMANIIPLRDVWESQLEELKEILNKSRVKNNL